MTRVSEIDGCRFDMSGDFPHYNYYPGCGHRTYTAGDMSKSVPAFMPAYLPFPSMGVTVATLDKDGNLTIKVDQPSEPPKPNRDNLDNILRQIGSGQKIDAIKQYRDMYGTALVDAKNAIELAMPVRPVRESPEVIANRVWDDWDGGYDRAGLVPAIAAAISAERG